MNARWSPGIGDPDLISWVTVAAYLAAAAACGWVAWRSGGKGARKFSGPVPFWGGIALLLMALGINKELDLQSLLTQTLRDAAMSEGWYEWRRALQATFIFGLLVVGAGVGGLAWRRIGVLQRNMLTALFGVAAVFTYAVIRAASFHHVALSITQHVLGHQWIWPLEIGGTVIVFYAAVREARRLAAVSRAP